jgi:hypothetical protein
MDWLNKYVKCLSCINPDELKIEESQILKIENMPRYLYKFRSPTDYSLENLKNDMVWLNSPNDYNDPFDCVQRHDIDKLLDMIMDINKDKIIDELKHNNEIPPEILDEANKSINPVEYLFQYLFINKEGKTREEVRLINQAIRESTRQINNRILAEKIREQKEWVKVSSFCENHKSILMWSHYADFHKGFCVEYDLSKWNKEDIRRRILCPVIYQDDIFDSTEYLLYFIKNKKLNNLYSILMWSTKAKDWSYEKEWRMIFNIGPSFQRQCYKMNCQSSVYIGCNIAENYKEKLINICNANNLSKYQAKQSLSKYELGFERI